MLRKKSWLKIAVIMLTMLLAVPLAGCDEDAAPLKEGFVQSLDVESMRSTSTLTITNNVPKDQLNPAALAVFGLLEEGIVMDAEMASLQSMKIKITPGSDDVLRYADIWTYPEKAAFDLIIDGNRFALKTSADPAYLVLDPLEMAQMDPEADVDVSALLGEDYYEQQVEVMMEFLTAFMQDFDYPLSRVEQLGTVELEMPDETIEAQGIKVEMDFEEILDLLVYSLEYLAESDMLKDYLEFTIKQNLENLVEAGLLSPEELPTEAEIEEMLEMSHQEIQRILLESAEYLEDVSPAMLEEEFGLELSAVEEYYLDEDGYIRKTTGVYQIKGEHEMLEELLGASKLDLTIESDQKIWDIGQPVEVSFPPEEEQVSIFALMEDPELAQEMEEGPMKDLATMLAGLMAYMAPGEPQVVERQFMIINLETGEFVKDGEPLELEVEPYLEEGIIMVPFRDLAETAGGNIGWEPETQEVRYLGPKLEMSFSAGSTQALVNGETVELETPVALKEGRTMVPAELAGKLAQEHFVEGSMAFFSF